MTNRIAENPVSETLGTMPWAAFELKDGPQRFSSSAEMVAALGLDWTVCTAPLVNARTSAPCRNFREVIREDTGETLGIVKGYYRAIQNVDAFGFLPEVAADKGLEVVAGGSLDDGAKTWILAKLGEVELPNRILPNGERDRIVHHLLFWNSHDGSSSRKIAAVPYAFWCANALASAWKNAEHAFSTQHSKSAPWRLDDANRSIAGAMGWLKTFEQQLVELDAQRIKRAEVKALAEQVLEDVHGAIKGAQESLDESQAKRRQTSLDKRAEKAEQIAQLFEGGGVSCRGESKLDAYQAITEFIDHHRARRTGARMTRFEETLTGHHSAKLRAAALRRLA